MFSLLVKYSGVMPLLAHIFFLYSYSMRFWSLVSLWSVVTLLQHIRVTSEIDLKHIVT